MSKTEMKIDPTRAAALVSQLQDVNARIIVAAQGRPVRLVAVSKLKPANDILALHRGKEVEVHHFGENYAQELSKKAEILPSSVRWHFIGGLQSGHCKGLARIPNLWCVSSIDSLKKAELLNRYRGDLIASAPGVEKLNVHVQVNTSGEEAKSGCSPGPDTVSLCRAIVDNCPNLHLLGLMTIGAIARSVATSAENGNEDFITLKEQRDLVVEELGIKTGLELSMGMSQDFEGAIALGSDEVRIGSTIFGERGPKADARLLV